MRKTHLTAALTLVGSMAILGCNNTANNTVNDNSQNQVSQLSPLQQAKYDAKTFFDTTTYFGSKFSADGQSILMGSDETGVFNLYKMDVESGEKQTLTNFKDTTYPVSWFPKDDRVLLTQDNGGDELFHLYVRELNGTVSDLTPGDNVRASFITFSKDGQYFYVLSNERDAKFMDLYRYRSDNYQRELLYTNTDGFNVTDVSPDGHYAALSKIVDNRNSDTYLLDLKKKNAQPLLLTAHQEPAEFNPMTFTPDSQALLYSTNAHGEFTQVWQYDLASKQHSLAIKDDWDVNFVHFSDSGRYRVSFVNADASSQATLIDLNTGLEIAMPPLPAGALRAVNFTHNDSHISFYLNSDTSPNNLYVWKVGDKQARQLTQALSPAIDPNHLVDSKVVRFKSFDGLNIPGILYKPKTASANNKVPALIWVHGGPGGQSRTGYNAMRQHLVNQGYAIFAVNNRGSSGYGKTFFHLDDKQHGEGDLQDIVYGKKHLQTLDWVDADKIGIMGGSYGGFMTAAALTFEPEEFEVGINIFGVTNWVRTLNSIPPWWESFKNALYDEMGDPATDGERHKAISPLFHAHQIQKPLLVVQGANDPRVLQVESDELVEKVKQNGVPVEYVLFEDEGHGFTKKKNRITASEAYLSFLDQYLRK